jgi:hypothetical protein
MLRTDLAETLVQKIELLIKGGCVGCSRRWRVFTIAFGVRLDDQFPKTGIEVFKALCGRSERLALPFDRFGVVVSSVLEGIHENVKVLRRSI